MPIRSGIMTMKAMIPLNNECLNSSKQTYATHKKGIKLFPEIAEINTYTLIKESWKKYRPFENRTKLTCPGTNFENGIGSICNPCGEKCIGKFILKFDHFLTLILTLSR